jgi:PD-(D/E)XK endonuclease
MEHPKAVGDRSTLAIMAALELAGYAMLVPFGENTRYDLVLENGTSFARVQCKTGRLRGGAIRLAACSSYAHHSNPSLTRRDYLGEIDFFGVYCPETGGVYLVPIADAPIRHQGVLRVAATRNGQSRNIRMAAAYEIASLGPEPSSEPRASSGGPGSCA